MSDSLVWTDKELIGMENKGGLFYLLSRNKTFYVIADRGRGKPFGYVDCMKYHTGSGECDFLRLILTCPQRMPESTPEHNLLGYSLFLDEYKGDLAALLLSGDIRVEDLLV